MTITKEEIRQVLGALHADPPTADWDDAIALLQSKLAEVDAEPVACLVGLGDHKVDMRMSNNLEVPLGYCIPLFTRPANPWVGLTEEEMMAVHHTMYGCGTEQENLLEMGELVEAKLKEKNT
jgi:hypothetical protein